MAKRLTIRISDDEIAERLEAEAAQRDRSLAYIVEECVAVVLGDTTRPDSTPSDTPRIELDRIDTLEDDVAELRARIESLESPADDSAVVEPGPDSINPTPRPLKTGLHDPESAAQWALDNLPVSKADIIDTCYDESVATINSQTWYNNRVRELLKESDEVEFVRNRGWSRREN